MDPTISVWGPEKSGKSSLVATFPKPIRWYDFDMGFDRASVAGDYTEMDRLVKAGDIKVMSLATPFFIKIHPNQPLVGYRELWTRFLEDFLITLGDSTIRTICIDTATQCWEICHTAFLQELQERQLPLIQGQKLRERLIPIEYGEPNGRMRMIEQAAKGYNKNLVMTHYQKPVYGTRMKDGQMEEYDTGQKQLDGFKHTANLSDLVLRTELKMERVGESTLPKSKVIVTTSGLTMNLLNVEIEDPTYDKIMTMVARLR